MAKKYSILVENEEIIAVEVDGVRYKTVNDIRDEDDREKMLLLTESWPGGEMVTKEVKPSPLPKIIPLVFLAVAILMLGIAVIFGIGTARRVSREDSAPGRVVDLVLRGSSGNEYYYPVVEFALPDGTTQTTQLANGSWPAAYKVGDSVTVAYDRQHPETARVKSTSSTLGMYTVTIIAGMLGLAFAAGTVFAWWVVKPSPDEVQQENSRLPVS